MWRNESGYYGSFPYIMRRAAWYPGYVAAHWDSPELEDSPLLLSALPPFLHRALRPRPPGEPRSPDDWSESVESSSFLAASWCTRCSWPPLNRRPSTRNSRTFTAGWCSGQVDDMLTHWHFALARKMHGDLSAAGRRPRLWRLLGVGARGAHAHIARAGVGRETCLGSVMNTLAGLWSVLGVHAVRWKGN